MFAYQFSQNYREIFFLLFFGSFFSFHIFSVELNFMLYYAHSVSYNGSHQMCCYYYCLSTIELHRRTGKVMTNITLIDMHRNIVGIMTYLSEFIFPWLFYQKIIVINSRRRSEKPSAKSKYFRNLELHFSKC